MSRIRATLDIDTERLAEIIALRVAAMLGGQAPPQPGGAAYTRDDPAAAGEALPADVQGHRLGSRWGNPPDGGDL